MNRRLILMLAVGGSLAIGSGCSGADEAQAPQDTVAKTAALRTPSVTWFVDRAAARGLDFEHVSGAAGRYLLPEIMGGGAALADLDGDGDLDAYLVQSGHLPGSAALDGTAVPGNRLFLNRGDGSFIESHNSGADDRGYGMGVTVGDYDNDGDVDLYVTNVGPNVLLQNAGDGTFTDVTIAAGVGDPGFSTAAVFFDPDGDGDLDLFVVNYVTWSLGRERDCYDYGTGIRNYCDPGNYDAPAQDRLFRNNGDGSFTDVSASAGLPSAFGNGLGVISADFDGDGRADIFVANDKTMNQLWLNRSDSRGDPQSASSGNLQFQDEALLWGCAMDDHGIAKAGMGVASADIDDDGDADLLVVNIEGETDSLFRNEGTYFVDATASIGLGTTSRRYTRFGVALADFDNDGNLDLFEANGRVTYSPEPEAQDVFAEPNALFRGLDSGRFLAVEPPGGVDPALIHTSRGVALGDVDGDGGLDLLVVNRDARAYLLLNALLTRGAWARFRVLTNDGRDAHGATVSGTVGNVRKFRDVQTAGSYLAAHEPTVHFGLATHTRIGEVVVRWPDAGREAFGDFPAGATVVLRRGAGRILPAP